MHTISTFTHPKQNTQMYSSKTGRVAVKLKLFVQFNLIQKLQQDVKYVHNYKRYTFN